MEDLHFLTPGSHVVIVSRASQRGCTTSTQGIDVDGTVTSSESPRMIGKKTRLLVWALLDAKVPDQGESIRVEIREIRTRLGHAILKANLAR